MEADSPDSCPWDTQPVTQHSRPQHPTREVPLLSYCPAQAELPREGPVGTELLVQATERSGRRDSN